MLRHGLGRAVLFLRNEPDLARFHDIIREACLKDWRYDSQVEADRAPYLFDVIEASGEPEYYAAFVHDELETIATPQEAEGACRPQLLALAALLTKSGHGDLKAALYQTIGRTAGETDGITGHGHILIGLDGITGYRFLVEQLIRFPQTDEDRWSEIRLLNSLNELLGETAAAEALDRLALDAQHLAPYLMVIRQACADDKVPVISASEPLTSARAPITASRTAVPIQQKIHAYISGEHRAKPRMRLVNRAVWEQLAAELGRETDRERRTRYLYLFRSAGCVPFPGDPEVLLRLIRQTEDERLTWGALAALEYTTHPTIRATALELLRTDHRVVHGMRLLPYNPGVGDADLMAEHVSRDQDPDTFHFISLGILNYVKRHADPGLIPVMLTCYEKMRCALCRRQIVHELLKRDALPPELRAECRYDADPETRTYV
ncbi:MAG: hypothetical protein H8F28_15530 [Fibrella sp.]|nr:hypothetical protein [Armatimonadota bacterium]